jgi:competence protein ComEA
VPRPRPDPAAAAERLAAVVPIGLSGGWLPPPEAVTDPPAAAVERAMEIPPASADAGRSWAARPAEPDDDARQGLLAGFVPTGLRGGRWDPGRRGAAALAGVAVVAALLAAVVLVRSRPHEVAPPAVVSAAATPSSGGEVVVVDVAGKVRHPGIVRLPLGSRVDDAVRAAGGPLPGATYDGLNRARKLTDGEQVLVGVQPAGGGPAAAGGDARLDINAADVTALDGLPGIGPVLAQKIVDWRTEHGRFASVDQLREVGGIGESKFAALKNKVRT